MEKKPDFTPQDAMRLAQTPAGKELLNYLQQYSGSALQQALEDAATGQYQKAKEELAPILSSPKIQTLLNRLEF